MLSSDVRIIVVIQFKKLTEGFNKFLLILTKPLFLSLKFSMRSDIPVDSLLFRIIPHIKAARFWSTLVANPYRPAAARKVPARLKLGRVFGLWIFETQRFSERRLQFLPYRHIDKTDLAIILTRVAQAEMGGEVSFATGRCFIRLFHRIKEGLFDLKKIRGFFFPEFSHG
jgi:hypothetical protein